MPTVTCAAARWDAAPIHAMATSATYRWTKFMASGQSPGHKIKPEWNWRAVSTQHEPAFSQAAAGDFGWSASSSSQQWHEKPHFLCCIEPVDDEGLKNRAACLVELLACPEDDQGRWAPIVFSDGATAGLGWSAIGPKIFVKRQAGILSGRIFTRKRCDTRRSLGAQPCHCSQASTPHKKNCVLPSGITISE